jgi:hypothetical protein
MYIKKIASITKRGDAREESYYPAFAELLEEFSEAKRKKKAHVTVLAHVWRPLRLDGESPIRGKEMKTVQQAHQGDSE